MGEGAFGASSRWKPRPPLIESDRPRVAGGAVPDRRLDQVRLAPGVEQLDAEQIARRTTRNYQPRYFGWSFAIGSVTAEPVAAEW